MMCNTLIIPANESLCAIGHCSELDTLLFVHYGFTLEYDNVLDSTFHTLRLKPELLLEFVEGRNGSIVDRDTHVSIKYAIGEKLIGFAFAVDGEHVVYYQPSNMERSVPQIGILAFNHGKLIVRETWRSVTTFEYTIPNSVEFLKLFNSAMAGKLPYNSLCPYEYRIIAAENNQDYLSKLRQASSNQLFGIEVDL